jgi:ribonucleoside-diphosphate reductase alpha chain
MTTVQEWLGKNNKLGIDIWTNKYQFENETFNEWLDRVSNGNEDVKKLILEKKFLFGGRILSNRGLYKKGIKTTLSNCYVIAPPEDNIESIFECATKLARTYSYGGGCGIDISKLAPRGAKVRNTAKETSGSVSFMDLYSLVTGLIGQNGRRGALMISLACDHPDIEEFIEIKSDLERVTKANISIRITDKFMEAVEKNEDFVLSFTREETNDTITKTINARELFHKICEMNWDYAEPGMLFWDRIENWNLLSNDNDFHYAGTNPCAEEPLPAGGSCLLGSINLAEFVTKNKKFDYDSFVEAVDIAVRALNEVLDEGMPLHPLQEQRDSVRDWRQIGLGIFGLADMLIKMEVRYGSKESIALCDKIGFAMADQAICTSSIIAQEYGVYPKYNSGAIESSAYLMTNAMDCTYNRVKKDGLRNSQLLTIAPTGSLSSMLGVSGGIEPIFANYYTRKTESLHGHDEYYKVYTPIVEKYMKEHSITDDAMLPDFFVTAQELDYKDRIAMQSIWQSHIDASISSTVNVPNSFTVEDTENLYMLAWKSGLKGVTIFRDGCKRTGILTTTETKSEENEDKHELQRGEIIATDDNIIGLKRKLMTGCGSLHCQAFFDPSNGELREIYLSKGSTGGCNNFMIGLSRMISAAARAGVSLDDIVDQLMSTGACPSYAKRGQSKGSCCPMAIGYALKDMHKQFNEHFATGMKIEAVDTEQPKSTKSSILCPNCGEELVFEGGCNSCKACGWSKCDL